MSEEGLTALVLAADDDPDILGLVEMVLADEGYEVVTAGDGKRALELALERRPDVCVFDVMMPLIDGCELTRRLRQTERTRDVPILLLSARTQWEAVKQGREAGADEYVTKPFVPEDLQRSVRGLLAAPRPSEEPVLGLVEGGAEPGTGSTRVLVAAEDENLVKLVSYRFELGGYEVATAADGEAAARLAESSSPDICILDSSIPQPDGVPVKRVEPGVHVQELYSEVEQALERDRARRSA